jgi:septal ring factor EnvC (AmiA/AmiB activator)
MAAGGKKMAVPVPRGTHHQTMRAHPEAMLNKSESRRIAQLQATITELKATLARQQQETQALAAQVKEQAAQIQKVSAQLEMSQPAKTVVVNKP